MAYLHSALNIYADPDRTFRPSVFLHTFRTLIELSSTAGNHEGSVAVNIRFIERDTKKKLEETFEEEYVRLVRTFPSIHFLPHIP